MKRACLVLAACGGTHAAVDGRPADMAVDASPVQCGTLPATCGPARSTSCCESDAIAGGTFLRADDAGSDAAYKDANDPATLSDFRLDRYEITVGRFRAFVDAGGGTQASPPGAGTGAHPHLPSSGWDPAWNASLAVDRTALVAALGCENTALRTWTDQPSDNDDRPVNCITWYEAMAFCIWDGGYLPTEAERLYAAAGGSEQRAYPWSSPPGALTFDSTHASYGCEGDGDPGCWMTDLVVVGTLSAGNGRWGTADLADNVSEWTLDTTAVLQDPCVDCASLGSGSRMVIGGEFVSNIPLGHRSAYGEQVDPSARRNAVGARCARSP